LLFNDPARRLTPTDSQHAGPPGGAVALAEALRETARRETFEGTGLKIHHISLCSVFSGKEQYDRDPNGDDVRTVVRVPIGKGFFGEIQLSGEHCDRGGFLLSEMPADGSPAFQLISEPCGHFSTRPGPGYLKRENANAA